jgi:signal transduction histidine kinase
MSLRFRLTLLYANLLSGVVLLLSGLMYGIVNIVMINQVDNDLEHSADHIMDALWVDSDGAMGIDQEKLDRFTTADYQVWSTGDDLLLYSNPESPLNDVWNSQAVLDHESVFRRINVDGTAYRILNIPLEAEGEHYGWLQVGTSLTGVQQTVRMLGLIFLGVAIFAIAASSLVGWFVVGKGLQPLTTIVEISKNISDTEDLSLRLPVETGRVDEIGQLSLTFNQTLSRLERLFNTQRRFLADVSHELRTPLTVIKGNVGLMRMMHDFDQESLESIEIEVDRLTRMVGDLLLMAQAETGRLPLTLAPVEIDDLLFEVFKQLEVLSGGKHNIKIVDIEPAIVTGDRDRLKQVFLNLGVNAIKYTPDGKNIRLSLHVHERWAEIQISDEGRGVPKAEIGRLFERFYRGDKSRRRDDKEGGFGLGLPIAYWIVRTHGGRIDVETEVDVGTTFSVWLPISQTDVPTRPLDI